MEVSKNLNDLCGLFWGERKNTEKNEKKNVRDEI
jgi:hypothetical protein